ncbi:hypothetical protein Golob_022017, partial [Gossypium lobatum]|nr:hypothetical protein [Gossypium lobatum]
MVDPIAKQPIVWKDKLIGHSSISGENSLEEKEDFNLLKEDIQKSINVNVQPWIVSFNLTQAFLNMVISWIRLLGLPRYLYKFKILVEIRGMVGNVAKLDMNTDNRVRGWNIVVLVRVNSVASRSSIGHVSSSKRTNRFQIIDDRFSEGLREKRNRLDLNGSLGVKGWVWIDDW